MIILGISLAIVSGFALAMGHVTQTIPFRWPWNWLREDDPKGFDFYQDIYTVVFGVGLILIVVGAVMAFLNAYL